MPGSRGNSPTTPEKVAEWQARTFRKPPPDLGRADREIPLDPLDDPEAAREAIDRFRSTSE